MTKRRPFPFPMSRVEDKFHCIFKNVPCTDELWLTLNDRRKSKDSLKFRPTLPLEYGPSVHTELHAAQICKSRVRSKKCQQAVYYNKARNVLMIYSKSRGWQDLMPMPVPMQKLPPQLYSGRPYVAPPVHRKKRK